MKPNDFCDKLVDHLTARDFDARRTWDYGEPRHREVEIKVTEVTKDDLKEINWSVLWMVAGGFALGLALTSTGLAEHLVTSIPFGEWLPIAVILVSGFIGYFISNFISNTAAASLIVPILCAVGVGMGETLDPLGGSKTLLIGAVLCTSLAMLFPISTPPNALAHSTGLVTTKDMTKVGIIIGIIGFVLGYAMLFLIGF